MLAGADIEAAAGAPLAPRDVFLMWPFFRLPPGRAAWRQSPHHHPSTVLLLDEASTQLRVTKASSNHVRTAQLQT